MKRDEKGDKLRARAVHSKLARSVGRKLTVGLVLIALLLPSRGAGLLAAASHGGSGLGLAGEAFAAPAASNGGFWLRIRRNLSGSPSLTSGYPDIAIDDSGDYVAVVWTEGYDSSEGAKHHGRVYLRWNSENTGIWQSKVTVDDGTNTADDWTREAAVALQRDAGSGAVTAHVVWVRFEKGIGWRVNYRACTLGGPSATCGAVRELARSVNDALPLFVPDIAADSDGRLFVAWAHKVSDLEQVIEYREFDGVGWSAPSEIAGGVNDWPTVAVRGNTVYAAWMKKVGTVRAVESGRKTVGGTSWEFPAVYSKDGDMRTPFLAAGDDAVFLSWEAFLSNSPSGKDEYSVRYKSDSGSGWQPEAANQFEAITDTTSLYVAVPDGEEYLQVLRPALAVGSDGALHAVWHENHYVPPQNPWDPTINEYRVLHSYSITPTASSPVWSEPVIFASLSHDGVPLAKDNVSPRVAVGGTAVDPHIHVVLMLRTSSAWDVWYLSNQMYSSLWMPDVRKNG